MSKVQIVQIGSAWFITDTETISNVSKTFAAAAICSDRGVSQILESNEKSVGKGILRLAWAICDIVSVADSKIFVGEIHHRLVPKRSSSTAGALYK